MARPRSPGTGIRAVLVHSPVEAVHQPDNPLQRVKLVHLMRHGEGEHNAACDAKSSEDFYESEEYADAPLTQAGEQQARDAAKGLKGAAVQLVVASPLTRTLQTVSHILEALGWEDAAVQPKLVALEACREGMTYGVHPCNRRRPISVVRQEFPDFDFSEIADDPDVIWDPAAAESDDALDARVTAFLEWLAEREEEVVLVSTHCVFLHALLSRHVDVERADCSDPWFGRGELRTFKMFFEAGSGAVH